MDEVLKLVNRLQGACTLLGDTAGQEGSDLPGLWEMLPSIVVIGGQVNPASMPHRYCIASGLQRVPRHRLTRLRGLQLGLVDHDPCDLVPFWSLWTEWLVLSS